MGVLSKEGSDTASAVPAISATSKNLFLGDTSSVTIQNAVADVTWSVNGDGIVSTAPNGSTVNISAIGIGTCDVVGLSSGVTYTCHIKVVSPVRFKVTRTSAGDGFKTVIRNVSDKQVLIRKRAFVADKKNSGNAFAKIEGQKKFDGKLKSKTTFKPTYICTKKYQKKNMGIMILFHYNGKRFVYIKNPVTKVSAIKAYQGKKLYFEQ